MQTCSLVDLTAHGFPSADIRGLATEVHMVGERAVCILLECFLVGMADSGLIRTKKVAMQVSL